MQNTTNQSTTSNSPSPSTVQSKKNTRQFSQGYQNSSTTKKRINGKNSRYAQKARGNKNKKPVAAKPKGPVNTYTSVCCGVPATKKAVVAVDKKAALEQTLGKWRCSGCKKRCKVTVSKYKVPETLTQEGWKPSNEVKPNDTVIAEVNNG